MQSKLLLFALCIFVAQSTVLESARCRRKYKCVEVLSRRPFGIAVIYVLLGAFLFNSVHTWILILITYFEMDWSVVATMQHEGERYLPFWLKLLALGTPIITLLNYFVSISHTMQHCWAGLELLNGGQMAMKRQRVLQVVMLPMVYSCMACQSVLVILELCVGNDYRGKDVSWEVKVEDVVTEYEANLDTADFYEAYALHLFCRLVLDELKSWARNERLESNLDTTQSENQELILSAMASLTTLGVDTFVYTSAVYALYSVLKTIYDVTPSLFQMPELVTEQFHNYLFGAGFIASCTAITNVVKIELGFHKPLHHFGAGTKFWSVKVLVSIAFIQKLAITAIASNGYFGDMGDLQQKLLYAALICYELFFIAALHVRAWPHGEDWILKDKVKFNKNQLPAQEDVAEPLLEEPGHT